VSISIHQCRMCGERTARSVVLTGDFTADECSLCKSWQIAHDAKDLLSPGDDFQYLSQADWVKSFEGTRRSAARRVLDQLRRLGPTSGRLLDIGCAFGWFLDESQKRGWSAVGIEPAVSAATYSWVTVSRPAGKLKRDRVPQPLR
jgi:hypothetical protein